MAAKSIMIQGTMSNAGKSLLAAGLCRIFRQDGYRVAPFKSQNMALNSYVTADGLEMGRAQVMQAEAAGILPDVRMNPILLKPTTDTGSQVIVNGEVLGDMDARRYFAYKKSLMPMILDTYRSLARENDVIVIEGAGSPAEINLKKDDIVNMGLAKAVGAPVLLAGDIDRGGVFAQLLGTQMLLDPDEQALLKGLIINKFRGDKSILDPGVRMLEERSGLPVVGVVPYMRIDVDDEDSLSPQLAATNSPPKGKPVEIAVVRLPHLSNFTDFNAFLRIPEVDLRYVSRPEALGAPDLIILPGTKNTMADLLWLRQSGMEEAIRSRMSAAGASRGGEVSSVSAAAASRDGDVSGMSAAGASRSGEAGGTSAGGEISALSGFGQKSVRPILFGICGGFQMLGKELSDPEGVETGRKGEHAEGLGLLDAATVFEGHKRRTQVRGKIGPLPGALAPLTGMEIEGYEIHMGSTKASAQTCPFSEITDLVTGRTAVDGLSSDGASDGIYGTYVHGIFDAPGIAPRIAEILAGRKGLTLSLTEMPGRDYRAFKETQYDLLADTLRRHLDMKKIYEILEKGV